MANQVDGQSVGRFIAVYSTSTAATGITALYQE